MVINCLPYSCTSYGSFSPDTHTKAFDQTTEGTCSPASEMGSDKMHGRITTPTGRPFSRSRKADATAGSHSKYGLLISNVQSAMASRSSILINVGVCHSFNAICENRVNRSAKSSRATESWCSNRKPKAPKKRCTCPSTCKGSRGKVFSRFRTVFTLQFIASLSDPEEIRECLGGRELARAHKLTFGECSLNIL